MNQLCCLHLTKLRKRFLIFFLFCFFFSFPEKKQVNPNLNQVLSEITVACSHQRKANNRKLYTNISLRSSQLVYRFCALSKRRMKINRKGRQFFFFFFFLNVIPNNKVKRLTHVYLSLSRSLFYLFVSFFFFLFPNQNDFGL